MQEVFNEITLVTLPDKVVVQSSTMKNEAFSIAFQANGVIPFPQVIIRGGNIGEILFKEQEIILKDNNIYQVNIGESLISAGSYSIQIEGCKREDIENAQGSDWVKVFREIAIEMPSQPQVQYIQDNTIKIYYGIHKHMHQPYYNATDVNYWDGEKEEIFGSRGGAYTHYIADAIRQYRDGGLPHAGLSTSWSGSLIEQLHRCARDGLCGGRFYNWNDSLKSVAHEKTALGHNRVNFVTFGHFHPLMSLIPERDIIKQIQWHKEIIHNTFGVSTSDILFPPETAFHVRMIPALNKAGVKAVIYDSIHRYRASKNYPYAGTQEGMLPPNLTDQVNPQITDWLQLHNIWAGSLIAPSVLKPEYIQYEDIDGNVSKIIGIPAERYIGNEDARGGFGALQYPDVFGQLYNSLANSGLYDPKHPTFLLLHSDGDNYGGGTDSYYQHNTAAMVNWLQQDQRFELIGIEDYLQQFPPDPNHTIHLEPGSWSGADNGDPQFMKWFSRYMEDYSPDLNSWAVLTALQNLVHSLEDAMPDHGQLLHVERLLLTAQTSCYWYWTGQNVWDQQVSNACNQSYAILEQDFYNLQQKDSLGPSIFAPWVTPENPGGKTWGQGGLIDAKTIATVHTFIYDINAIKRVECVIRADNQTQTLTMQDRGVYPSQTQARISSHYYTLDLPQGLGDVRYYIEAEDNKGNIARSALERIYLV